MTKGERILAAYLTAFLLGIISVSFGAGLIVGGVYKGRTLRVERDAARAEVARLREVVFGPQVKVESAIDAQGWISHDCWTIENGKRQYANCRPHIWTMCEAEAIGRAFDEQRPADRRSP